MIIRQAAIFGATGATGKYLAQELCNRGIVTRVVSRSHFNLDRVFGEMDVETVVADLQEEDAAKQASDSCNVIFHCVGLPVERFRDHIPISQNTISAMQTTGAKGVVVRQNSTSGEQHSG